jgi:hypothetical protein
MNVEEASSGESCAMHYKNGFAGAELRYSRKPFAAHTKLNAWRIAVDQEITDCDLRHSGYQVVLQQGVICLHRNFSKRSPLRVMIPTELSEKNGYDMVGVRIDRMAAHVTITLLDDIFSSFSLSGAASRPGRRQKELQFRKAIACVAGSV